MRVPVRPLDPADHVRRPWRVHTLAATEGLELKDVWEVDVELPPQACLEDWIRAFRRERLGGAARLLFGIRRVLGQILRLDPARAGFVPVYVEPDEQLLRIENRTVVALLHFSLADRRPRLAVYVRARGYLGRVYLWLIQPFRLYVVYPRLVAAGRRAAQHLTSPRADRAT
jgi:Protein of unknown function (DUF2867)